MVSDTKIQLKIIIPKLETEYNVFMPINKRIQNAINLIEEAVEDLSGGYYKIGKNTKMYNKDTGKELDYNLSIKELGLKNGDSVVLL